MSHFPSSGRVHLHTSVVPSDHNVYAPRGLAYLPHLALSIARQVADRMLVDELSLIRLQAHYSIPPPLDREHRSMRALSVDGRKMSLLTSADIMKPSAEKA
ncbi:hypothetical protein DICVIV_10929 [Dictyocaulus viviparus]|uniref:Uncharacterized protein n=1 Tax=Dictyocaulus viviparus TaxID=29172 RepID=A0A0D8XL39_DICVI|nr:hypothetical protein DICVIV_10929 [Dictyocaulus viviparus]